METPTVDLSASQVQSPTWEIRVNGTPNTKANLQRVTLGYGTAFSIATFIIHEDPDTGTFPAYNDAVEVDINGRNVLKGKIKGITSRISSGGLNKTFTVISNITTLTEKVVDSKTQSEFNKKDIEKKDRLNVAQILNQILGFIPVGAPTEDPGTVTVRDMTKLDAMQTVLNKVGNFKIFWNNTTNLPEVYRFGKGGDVTRQFEKGVNIGDSAITENRQSIVDKLTLIGSPIAIRTQQFVDTNLDRDENGVFKQSFTLTGKNIREIKVEGQFRDKPFVEFNGKLQILPEDMGIIALSTTNETAADINTTIADLNVELAIVKSNSQFETQSVLQRQAAKIEESILSEQGKLISLFPSWPFFPFAEIGNARRDIGFREAVTKIILAPLQFAIIGTSLEYDKPKDKVKIFLSNVPQIFFMETLGAFVPKERLGITGGGFGDVVSIRIRTRLEWQRGAVRVTFTEDGDCPQIIKGGGTVERTITDPQYQIIQNSVDIIPGFDNEAEILEIMQERADAEFEKLNRPTISGGITVLGDETIDLRSTVLVNSTKLDVVSITHDLARGFATTIALTNEPFIALTAFRSAPEQRRQRELEGGTQISFKFDEVEIDQDKTTQRQIQFQRRLEEAGVSFSSYQD